MPTSLGINRHLRRPLAMPLFCFLILAACAESPGGSELKDAGAPNLQVLHQFQLAGCKLKRLQINPAIPELSVFSIDHGLVQSFSLRTHDALWTSQLRRDEAGDGTDPRVEIEAIAFSPDGDTTSVGGKNFLAQLSSRTGTVDRVMVQARQNAQDVHYTALATSADMRFIAAVGILRDAPADFDLHKIGKLAEDFQMAKKVYRQVLQLWDAESGRLIQEVAFADALVRHVGFSPRADLIFTGSYMTLRFFQLPALAQVFAIGADDHGVSRGSASIFVSTAVSRDHRFVALKTLGPIYLVATESKKVVSMLYSAGSYDLREVIGSSRHIEFGPLDASIEATDLDGLYISLSLPSGEVLASGHSEGSDRAKQPYTSRHPLLAMDPERRFVIETTPPPMRQFPLDTRPYPPRTLPTGPVSNCSGLRMVRLPEISDKT